MSAGVSAAGHEETELEALRARLATLEDEQTRAAARANAAVAAAEQHRYWLDRWEVDLDALMRTRTGRLIDLGFGARRRVRALRERYGRGRR